MTKKHFIALADAIREHNRIARNRNDASMDIFTPSILETVSDFCKQQNYNFNRDRWLGYIAGTNGKNGGAIKA